MALTLNDLRRLRAAVARASELEVADIDRQIAAIERAKPRLPSATRSTCDSEQALLRVMQAAETPLPPREIAQRLNVATPTVFRWLAAAQKRGFVERVSRALYQARKEVPRL